MNKKIVVLTGSPRMHGNSDLLACAETENETDFDGLVRTYELIASYQKWTDRAHLLIPSVSEKGDILHTDALERAEKLGRMI
ncbi:MAG: hypothetical protein M0P01_03650 [Treponema sp.]|nr:hypothetical protein [Treponema sp.]